MNDLDTLVDLVVKEGASDLHISEERNPYLRVSGTLVPLTKYPKFTKTLMQNILESVLSDSKKVFSKLSRADFAYDHKGERFRAHAFLDQQKICMVFRHILKKNSHFG